jgi:flagellar motor protein MotB
MAWRRRDDFDNPAWPGMVDIFAFTLALFMIFWFAGNFPAKLENLEKKTQDLTARMRLLDSKNIHLTESNRNLSAKLEALTQNNQNLLAQVDSLQEKNRELDSQNKSLTSGTLALNAKIAHLDEENIQLRDVGRKDWEELLKLLQEKLVGLPMKIIPNQRDKEIEIQGNPKITFETNEYDLTEFDQNRLEQLATILRDLRQSRKFFITINGTADPRELQRDFPPRNNTELSALRAATVAAVLENAAAGLGQHLRILGLGSKGVAKTLTSKENPETIFRQYRTVSLVLKVDVASLLQEGQPSQNR